MNLSRVQNVDQEEDIVWEGESDSESDDVSTEMIEKALAPEELLVVGSRFSGVNMANLPLWLKEIDYNDCVLNINGVIHLYTTTEGAWYPLRSVVSLKAITTRFDLFSPVNYATAAEPFVAKIEEVAWPIVTVYSTFTQGSLRYRFSVDEEKMVVKFEPCVYIGKTATPKSTLCAVPVNNVNPVLQMSLRLSNIRAQKYNAMGWLYKVFGSNINTVLWAIGDMLYDSANKRMFILFGPGGVGKSTVANIINGVIGGTVPSLSSELICVNPRNMYKKRLTKDEITKAASSRVISLGDVEATDQDEINMQHVKVLTGGDDFNGTRVHTTLIMTVNRLFQYNDLSTFIHSDRLRRVVVVPTVEERSGENVDALPLHPGSLDELVQYSLRIRIRHKMPPLKTDALLATLFQARYKEALEIITIEVGAPLYQCMAATNLLCWRFGVELQEMSRCLKMVGCGCAVESSGTYFIANIRMLEGASIASLFVNPNGHKSQRTSYHYYHKKEPSALFS